MSLHSPELRWLAMDTSTDVLSLAVARGDQVYLTHGTDATAQLSFAIEATLTPGANVTA